MNPAYSPKPYSMNTLPGIEWQEGGPGRENNGIKRRMPIFHRSIILWRTEEKQVGATTDVTDCPSQHASRSTMCCLNEAAPAYTSTAVGKTSM